MRGLIGLLLLVLLAAAEASAATIHGNVFEWSTLEPLNNVIIDVNSTPPQRVVSKDGGYAFELAPGDYALKAEFYEPQGLKYAAEEKLRIAGEGRFVYDLIMLPPLEGFDGELEAPDLEPTLPAGQPFSEKLKEAVALGKLNEVFFWAVIAILVLSMLAENALLGGFLRQQKKRFFQSQRQADELVDRDLYQPALPHAERADAEKTNDALDAYAQEVVDTLKRCGNRLTQKELRDRMPGVGEAKISLIVSELEQLGRVKKIKHGRGNIIVLKEN